MATTRAIYLTKNKFIHSSLKELSLDILKNGYKSTKTLKIEAFWFAYESQWLTELSEDNKLVYEVVISPDKFISLDDEPSCDKILSVGPKDLVRFSKIYTKKGNLKIKDIVSKYGGLYFPDYNKSNTRELWYNVLDVSSGSIWNVAEIIQDLRYIGITDYITQWYASDDYDDLIDILEIEPMSKLNDV